MSKGKGGGAPVKHGANDDRKNGKAKKKHPRTGNEGTTGRTVGGYTPAKAEFRAAKRRLGVTTESEI